MSDKDYLIKGEMYQYNLGWLIKELMSFKQDLATAIDLKTIKYADPIQWDITTQYPANTVVVDPKSGTAYMSKVPVPTGVELTNTNYWVVVFNYQDIYNKIMDGVAFNDRDQDYATKDLLVNDLVWYAGDLYRVTRAIPTGSKYIPGTNLVKTSTESLLARYYGRDRTAQISNDTVNVSGDYTLVAGDIAETANNITLHSTKDMLLDSDGKLTEQITGDREIDVDGNDSVHIDGASTVNIGGLRTEVYAGDKTVGVAGICTERYFKTHTENNIAKKIENAKDKSLNVESLEINSTTPVKYKKPIAKGDLVTIPMQDIDGNDYNLLCEGTKLSNPSFSPYLFVGHDNKTAALIMGYTTDFSTFIPMARFDSIIARDPQIIYLNGVYYVCCTYYASDYAYDTVIYTTTNFKSWTRHNIDLGISNGPTWAPELALNNGTLYIFYAHTENEDYSNMKIYRSTCTNIDSLVFDSGVLVNGIPGNKIDPSIFYNSIFGYTVLIAKNENSKTNDMYDYDFETNRCSNWRLLNIPPHLEAVSCYALGNYVAIIADRYLAPDETRYGTQNIISTITSDLKNITLTLKMSNCFYNPNKEKVSGLRHVSCLKITDDMIQTLVSNIGSLTPIAVNRNNPYPEHVNIEDFGSLSGTTVTIKDFVPYPNTVYCIFNNPTGVTTPTTQVNLNSIINYFNLFDLYIYIGSDTNKTLTISTREGITSLNFTAADKDRFIHLRQGIDTKWSVVKGY